MKLLDKSRFIPAPCRLEFRQSEAQFSLSGVTMDATRFNHALIGPDEETIELITDVLENCSYVCLKKQLIWRLSVSMEAKLNHFLKELTIGDRTPSQLLREIKQLGGDKAGSELVKTRWLQRLPQSLEVLSATADKVHVTEVSQDMIREVDERKPMQTTLGDAITKLSVTKNDFNDLMKQSICIPSNSCCISPLHLAKRRMAAMRRLQGSEYSDSSRPILHPTHP